MRSSPFEIYYYSYKCSMSHHRWRKSSRSRKMRVMIVTPRIEMRRVMGKMISVTWNHHSGFITQTMSQ
jgi:hypothetical protein